MQSHLNDIDSEEEDSFVQALGLASRINQRLAEERQRRIALGLEVTPQAVPVLPELIPA